jgi:hypothetical protein
LRPPTAIQSVDSQSVLSVGKFALTGLDIRFNSIELGPLLSTGLANATSLTSLALAYNQTGEASGGVIANFLERNTQLSSLVLDNHQTRAVRRYRDEQNRQKLLAFAMGLHPRLGQASVVRLLGSVRGDRDELTRYDVPIFMFIPQLVLDDPLPAHWHTVIRTLESKYVNLNVKGPDGTTVHFRHVNCHKPLERIMQMYCDRKSLHLDQ